MSLSSDTTTDKTTDEPKMCRTMEKLFAAAKTKMKTSEEDLKVV